MSVAGARGVSHNVGMRKSSESLAAKMASDGHRLRHIREQVGASRFARAAHLALTSSKTFDEALALAEEEELQDWQLEFLHPNQTS